MKPPTEWAIPSRGGAIWLSGSSLALLQRCPVAGLLGWASQLEPVEERPALQFGSALHAALALHYAGRIKKWPKPPLYYIERCAHNHLDGASDWRNAETLLQLYQAYCREYEFVDFELPPNWNAVELRFAVPLGKVTYKSRSYPLIWNGRVDLVAKVEGKLWVVDHKTSSVMHSDAYARYALDSSLLGYTWAARQLGVEVQGYIVNLLAIRHTQKSGLSTSFARLLYSPEEQRIAEFRRAALSSVQTFLSWAEEEEFPMYTANCIQWTLCPFFRVCSEIESNRAEAVKVYLRKKDTTYENLI